MKTLKLVSLAAIAFSTPALAQNAVGNGSFENGFTGWTTGNVGGGTAPVVITYNNTNGYPTGAFGEPILSNTVTSLSPDAVGNAVAYFSSDTANPDSLTTSIVLAANTVYNLGFDYYAPRNGINNPFDASLSFLVGGVPVGQTLTAGSVARPPAATWFNFNTTFNSGAGGATNLTLEFRGLGVTAADFAIDRVYAVAAVPEPASWALMIGGFGIMGYTLRRRRSLATLATA